MIVKYDEFNEINEGVKRRENSLLLKLDDYIERKEDLNLNITDEEYKKLLKKASDHKWNGTWNIIKNPKNSIEKILEFQPI